MEWCLSVNPSVPCTKNNGVLSTLSCPLAMIQSVLVIESPPVVVEFLSILCCGILWNNTSACRHGIVSVLPNVVFTFELWLEHKTIPLLDCQQYQTVVCLPPPVTCLVSNPLEQLVVPISGAHQGEWCDCSLCC